ncbi:MAG: SsrA-binding protein SmpB [Candidatus Paceibacterota bacterium]|jgi:SsrA-binding protein
METIVNKKAGFNFEILDKLEAGIQLLGFEVKAIRAGKISLAGSYVKVYNNEVWLLGCSIAPFQEKNTPPNYEKDRPRRLLLHKEQIKMLIGKSRDKGLTIIPFRVYNKNNNIKVEVAITKGREGKDKREVIKKREVEREIRRSIKR